jgi:diguanylate cyclase (GGDEF)-like protein/PAS domain S-box-containing protein
MRCEVIYFGDNIVLVDEVCSVVTTTEAAIFIDKIKKADLAIVNANLKLSNKFIELMNSTIEEYQVPLMLYLDSDYNSKSFCSCNYTSVLRADDSKEMVEVLINNVINNHHRSVELLKDSDLLDLFLKYNMSYVFFKDENAKVIKLSDNFIDLLGITAESAIGKNMMEIFPSDLANSMVEDDLRILHNDESVEVIEELKGRFYKTSKFPIHREGKPSLLAGFTIDISDLKETEQLLLQSKERVEKLIVTDELLNISNRRGFLYDLNNEINRIERYGLESTLIIIDIDKFKNLNDTLGHFKADDFLRDLTIKVNKILRTSDIFGRLGGDEFAIVCVSTPIDSGLKVAERIRESVNKVPVVIDGKSYNYSVSIGLTSIDNKHLVLERLLHHADLALYEAKRSGRNCVKLFEQ